MYQRKNRMSTHQQYPLIEHFVAEITARITSKFVGVQPNIVIIPNVKTETLLPMIEEKTAHCFNK